MADALLLPVCLDRLTDSNGDPVSGGKVRVFDAGTSNDRDVFSDADLLVPAANPIVADSGGFLPARYIGTGAYKLAFLNPDDSTLQPTQDDLPGALDTSGFDDTTAIPDTPVISKAVNYNVVLADRGKVIAANATGGDISITLLSAVTAGDGFRVTVKNAGSSGTVSVATTGGQTIDGTTSGFDLEDANEAITVTSDGANWLITDDALLSTDITTPLPRSYLAGLQLSNNSSDADHDIDIAAGEARNSSNSFNFRLASTHVKRIDASWASGTGNGGLATGVSLDTDTWYHLFLVDDGDGSTEAGFDTSTSAANLLSDTGGSFFRLLGSVLTDGSSNILAFTQIGDEFLWADPPLDVDASDGTTAVLRTLSVPTGRKVKASLNVLAQAGGGREIYVSSPDANDEAASSTAAPLCIMRLQEGNITAVPLEVWTNTSSQVRTVSSGVATTFRIATLGWMDTRGRDE